MSQSHASLGSEQILPNEADTQLHGYQLILTRVVWTVITILAVVLCLVNIPPSYAQSLTVCTQAACQNQQATLELARALHSAGLSLRLYATYLMILSSGTVSVCVGIGVIIAWRKSNDWMGLLVSLTLIIIGTVIFTDYQQLATLYPIAQLPGELLESLLNALPLLVGYLFPNGRFAPRWTRWAALVVVFFVAGGTFFPTSLLNTDSWPDPLRTVAQFAPLVLVIFAQVSRYLRVSTPIQRQQTKWVLFGILATAIYFIALNILTTLDPDLTQASSLGILLPEASYSLAVLLIPLSIAFSILRYRLWDIDRLISRTLIYLLLSALLLLIYLALVFGLQFVLQDITKNSPVPIVVSTLAVVVLFQPLRRRVQNIIDRSFYRRKYNAEKVLASFGATLRNELELTQLSEGLVAVVRETMQPENVSLWLLTPVKRLSASGETENE